MLRRALQHFRQIQTRRFEMRGDFAVRAYSSGVVSWRTSACSAYSRASLNSTRDRVKEDACRRASPGPLARTMREHPGTPVIECDEVRQNTGAEIFSLLKQCLSVYIGTLRHDQGDITMCRLTTSAAAKSMQATAVTDRRHAKARYQPERRHPTRRVRHALRATSSGGSRNQN